MPQQEKETCWSLIRRAASGSASDRDHFARRYLPIVQGYLDARWRGTPFQSEVDDVAQEVFIACFREGGTLAGVRPRAETGFRSWLYGVTRNMAQRTERARVRRLQRVREGQPSVEGAVADERTLSRMFDRSYAITIIQMARERMTELAAERGAAHEKRVELLRLRFEEGLPVREIATLWGVDPAQVHREYQKANREFKAAFAMVVAESERCSPERLDAECDRLMTLLE